MPNRNSLIFFNLNVKSNMERTSMGCGPVCVIRITSQMLYGTRLKQNLALHFSSGSVFCFYFSSNVRPDHEPDVQQRSISGSMFLFSKTLFRFPISSLSTIFRFRQNFISLLNFHKFFLSPPSLVFRAFHFIRVVVPR